MCPVLQTSLPVFPQCTLGAHYRCLWACKTHHDAVVWTLFIKCFKTTKAMILKHLTRNPQVCDTVTVYAIVRQTRLFCVIVSVSVCLLGYIHRNSFVLWVIFLSMHYCFSHHYTHTESGAHYLLCFLTLEQWCYVLSDLLCRNLARLDGIYSGWKNLLLVSPCE